MIQPAWVGVRCAGRKPFVSGAAGSGACGTTCFAAAEGLADLEADAGALGTTVGIGKGSVNAAPGLMGAAGTAAVLVDEARALSDGAIGAGSAGSAMAGPRPEVLICLLLSVDVTANPLLSSSKQRSRTFSTSASKASRTVRGSVQFGEASGTTCAIAHTFLENPKLKHSSWSLMIFSRARLQAANREML